MSNNNEHPVYSKIDYRDAMQAKRNVLASQMNLLHIAKKLENYKALRKQELILKLKLKNDLKEVKTKINKIINYAPKTDRIKTLPTKVGTHITKKPKKSKQEKRHLSIEAQLKEIQGRLSKLG